MSAEPEAVPLKWWEKALIWTWRLALLLVFASLMSNAPPWAWGMLLGIYWIVRRKP